MNKEAIHEHDEHECECGCEHGHHEHEHHHHDDECGCGCEHHEHDHHHHHEDECGCGCEHHEHDHHHHDDGCGCGHDHHEHPHHEDDDETHEHDFDNISKKNQRIYIIEGLDCANCAAKMERRIQAMPEVQAASITFATKQLRVAAGNPDALMAQLEKECRTIEDNVKLVKKEDNAIKPKDEHRGFFRENAADLISIFIGIILFAAGVIFEHAGIFEAALLPIFIITYLILGWEVLLTSGKNILKGQIFDENFLMSIATIAAFCIGDFAEGAGVMLFYRIGELFEHIAVEKSRSQIMEAVDMRPETVTVADGSETRTIPANEAKPGDILIVRPGGRIPLDSVVADGESRIDTSPVTGEPVPVKAVPGSEVISGCVNGQGLLKIRVMKPLSESMVTRILDSVENAAAGKPKMDRFITRFAKIYTPIVVLLAVLTAIIPSIITGDWNEWITTAITFLVISCPCALVISVPLAFFSGIGAASKLGILFKGGLSIEALKNVKAVVMDKTGTITKGSFTVQQILPAGDISEEQLLSIAAACEYNSTHPIAVSIVEKAQQSGISIEKAASLSELSGKGIAAELSCGEVLCGNRALMKDHEISMENAQSSGGTEVFIAVNDIFAGSISIADSLKADAVNAVARLKSSGLTPAMLTGDNLESAAEIAAKVGISEVRAQLLPDDKLNALKDIREKIGPVMFVGDGINDAPVLAGADVGAAMGSGADAAIEAADVVFMNSSVESIPQSIDIAKSTNGIAVQNIIIALFVKLLVIILGFIGLANIWAAVFADTGVAMICILNSLRILWKKYR